MFAKKICENELNYSSYNDFLFIGSFDSDFNYRKESLSAKKLLKVFSELLYFRSKGNPGRFVPITVLFRPRSDTRRTLSSFEKVWP